MITRVRKPKRSIEADPLRARRDLFIIPDNTLYLDGNSLGPLPRHVAKRLAGAVDEEWGRASFAAGMRMAGSICRAGSATGSAKLIGARPAP